MNVRVLPPCNRALSSLMAAERVYMLASTELVALPVGKDLYEPNRRPEYAYFLTDGLASFMQETASGHSLEVGIVGRKDS